MQEQYEQILDRYRELQTALSQPDAAADPARWQAALKELSALEERVKAWQDYSRIQENLSQARQLLADPELAEMAGRDIAALEPRLREAERALRLLLLPRDPADERSVIMEIRAGAGGEESALFASELFRMYERYAARRGWAFRPASVSDTDLGGMKEAVFSISGSGVYARLKFESGVHRVQRVPVTEASGRKQTSACTVAVLPEAEEVDVQINPKDLRIDTYRASGAGGQYVNRTDSAVRITHLPTGIIATCQDEKSQLKNREQAMKVLRSRIFDQARREAEASVARERRQQVGSGDRSERIRTYNFHEGRVTDHRIGLTLYRIQDIMNGDLDEIIDGLRADEEARRLREAGVPHP